MSEAHIYYPPQYNYRSDNGPGGLNLKVMTPLQEALVKQWQKIGHKSSLPYMLLNHMTIAEQEEMARVYQTIGMIVSEDVEYPDQEQ